MLFDNYETFIYELDGRKITLTDIFNNISFSNVENNNAFFDYYIQEGESPEAVSARFYGTTSYSWLVLLVNNIIDRKNDWFEGQTEFARKRDLNFGGTAYYIPSLPDIQSGDVMVKVTGTDGNFATVVDETTYTHITSFDPILRKIRGVCGNPEFISGDSVIFGRLQSNGSVVPLQFNNKQETPELTDYTNIIYSEPYIQSLDYFLTGNNVVIDPYKNGITGYTVSTDVTYLQVGETGDNFAVTNLYRYGASGGIPFPGTFKQTIFTEYNDKYLEKQKIKILRKEYLSSVLTLIKNSLQSNEIGKVFKITI
jgi:hypothetical protein